MPVPLLPDPTDLTIRGLAAQAGISALVASRVYDRIPGSPTWPLLVVTTVSWSPELEWRRGRALMQVDCWGTGGDPTSTAAAGTLARTVVSVIPDLKGAWPPAGTVESAAFDLLLPQPDTTTGRARFLVQFSITTAAEGT